LAGLHAGLSEAKYERVAFVPCDTPFLPEDLVPRCWHARDENVDLSVAKTGTQAHPVNLRCAQTPAAASRGISRQGRPQVDAWYSTLRVTEVAFDDQPRAFSNINTPEELHAIGRDPRH